MIARTLPRLAALCLLLSTAGAPAQVPIVSVPDSPLDHAPSPLPRVALPEPLAAAALFDYNPSLPLRFTITGGQSQDNLRLVDATFDGAPGSNITCTFVLPPNPTHAPAVLFLHWGYTSREEFIPEALSLARRGVICLLIDAPFARPEPFAYDLATPGHNAALYVRAVIDCRRAVDLLRSRPDTDPTRIAFVGHSFGAYIGAILSGVEPRIGSFALMAAEPSVADSFRDDPGLARRREALGPERTSAYIAEMRPLDASIFLASARPMTILLQSASRDRDVTPEAARRLAAGVPSSTIVKTYLCGHELNDPQATIDRDDWLASRLSLRAGR